MAIKFDINKFLEDKASIFKLAILVVLAIAYVSPGLIIIWYFDRDLLISLSELKLFVFSGGISMFIHLLAATLIMSPPATQIEVINDPSRFRVKVLGSGTLMWSLLLLLVIPITSAFISWLYPDFSYLPEKYQLMYTYLLMLFFLIASGIYGFFKITIKHRG